MSWTRYWVKYAAGRYVYHRTKHFTEDTTIIREEHVELTSDKISFMGGTLSPITDDITSDHIFDFECDFYVIHDQLKTIQYGDVFRQNELYIAKHLPQRFQKYKLHELPDEFHFANLIFKWDWYGKVTYCDWDFESDDPLDSFRIAHKRLHLQDEEDALSDEEDLDSMPTQDLHLYVQLLAQRLSRDKLIKVIKCLNDMTSDKK